MFEWPSRMIKASLVVFLLNVAAILGWLSALPAAEIAATGSYALALAGVGWLIASRSALLSFEQGSLEAAQPGSSEAASAPEPKPEPPARASPPSPRPVDGEPDQSFAKLAEGCVMLVDELEVDRRKLNPAQRELAEHVSLRLDDILVLSGVEAIRDEESFDRLRHKAAKPSRGANGVAIAETLSPGYAMGRRVLRRARVRLEEGVEVRADESE